MANDPRTVEVKILDKDYMIACPENAELGLKRAADELDKKMRDIRNSGKIFGTEKIAVMAALNLAYELMENNQLSAEAQQNISAMNDKLDSILTNIK